MLSSVEKQVRYCHACATLGRVSLYRQGESGGLLVSQLQLGKSGSIARALTRRYDFEEAFFFFNQSNKARGPMLLKLFSRRPLSLRSLLRPRNSELLENARQAYG